QYVSSGISVLKRCRYGKIAGIEPSCNGAVGQLAGTYAIRPMRTLSGVRVVETQARRERKPRLEHHDSSGLPPGNKPAQRAGLVVQKPLPLAQGKLVDITEDEALRHVEIGDGAFAA